MIEEYIIESQYNLKYHRKITADRSLDCRFFNNFTQKKLLVWYIDIIYYIITN